MKILSMIALQLLYGSVKLCNGARWGYHGADGPSAWGNNYDVCNGQEQSPIDIVQAKAILNPDLQSFDRSVLDVQPVSLLLKDNGHSVQVDLQEGPTLDKPSFLSGIFKAAQFHLHWGGPGSNGSEHTMDGLQCFGELHIVHYNTKYNSLGDAADKSDGLAVLGYFLVDNYPQDNLAFGRVLNYIESNNVRYQNDILTYNQTFSLETLLPPGDSAYYRYKGSLTTPPCYESVMWTVFEAPIRISSRQANILRTMVFENERTANATEDVPLYDNYRPVQSLNERVVTKYQPCSSATTVTVLSLRLFLTATMLSLLTFCCI